MKFLIIFALTLAIGSALPSEEIKSRNIVVPAGKPQGRITNGHSAQRGQFPYQVGLTIKHLNGATEWCGGTLISNTEVITAAHCTENTHTIQVILGSTNRQYADYVHEVSGRDVIVHPGWDSQILKNDISIIRIPYTPYTENTQAAKLPTSANMKVFGETVIASGWGHVSDFNPGVTSQLQYAALKVISNEACASAYRISPSQICTSTYGQVSTCRGDSGGPLVLPRGNILVGITSYGGNSCEQNSAAVFTRVSSFLDWIRQNSNVSL